MEERRIRTEREEEIDLLAEALEVQFPPSYRKFLLEQGSAEVAGFQILGLPERRKEEEKLSPLESLKKLAEELERIRKGKIKRKIESSIFEATLLLRQMRPDLSERKLVVISFHPFKDKVLCLDTESGALLETTLKTKTILIPISNSFEEWIKKWEEKEKSGVNRRFLAARQRIENRENEIRERIIRRIIDREKRFRLKCPVCETRERGRYLTCAQCFQLWQRQNQIQNIEFIDWLQEKLEAKRIRVPKFTKRGGSEISHIHLNPQDWHCWRYAAHDYIVILSAFRWNYTFNCLEVDECWSAVDDPRFPPGEVTKYLFISLFTMAQHFGGSLNLLFTRYIGEEEETGKIKERNWEKILPTLPPELVEEARKNNGRIHRPVPKELVELAKGYGISFKGEKEGRISHQEGADLFFALFELPEKVKERVEELEKAKYLSKEMLCEIMAAGIWKKEEVIWFFLNVPRPEAIIFGSDTPENRLFYSESSHWGRSVYLASLLKQKILVDLSGGLSEEERVGIDCQLEPREEFWVLRANQGFYLPWQIKGSEPVWVEPGEPVLILSKPQQTSQPDYDKAWLERNVSLLERTEAEAKIRCLLIGFEFSDLKYGMRNSEEMKEISRNAAKRGVYLLFSPYKLDILSDEVEERMGRVRRMRYLEPRSYPLKLQLIEVPKEVWQEPALKFSVEDALSAASWIAKRIDLRLGRIRFRTNCQVIERIAIQDPRNKKIAELDGKESEELLEILRSEKGITLPFVQPEKMSEFLGKLGGRTKSILAKVQGGIIVIVPPYEKSTAEIEVKQKQIPTEKETIVSVPKDFQFPIDPENIDYSRYKQGYRKEEIRRFHEQIQEALREGQPLAVSYLPHELFPEVMRDYIYYATHTEYRKEPFLIFGKQQKGHEKREPAEPVWLRISYHDGTEGEPFPLFCLAEPERIQRPENLYVMKVGSISMRHVNLDLITEGYLMRNMALKRKGRESAAAQEDYAFRITWHYLSNFVDLVQHKRVEEITQEVRFKYLWNWLKDIKEREYKGVELHIFQTGLEPAVVGMYRAIVEFLQKRRGELIVVPRLISHREWRRQREEEGIQGITEDTYIKTAEWF